MEHGLALVVVAHLVHYSGRCSGSRNPSRGIGRSKDTIDLPRYDPFVDVFGSAHRGDSYSVRHDLLACLPSERTRRVRDYRRVMVWSFRRLFVVHLWRVNSGILSRLAPSISWVVDGTSRGSHQSFARFVSLRSDHRVHSLLDSSLLEPTPLSQGGRLSSSNSRPAYRQCCWISQLVGWRLLWTAFEYRYPAMVRVDGDCRLCGREEE